MTKQGHIEAAERHEQAAIAHRTAAEIYDGGDAEAARRQTIIAHEYSKAAHDRSAEMQAKVGDAGPATRRYEGL